MYFYLCDVLMAADAAAKKQKAHQLINEFPLHFFCCFLY